VRRKLTKPETKKRRKALVNKTRKLETKLKNTYRFLERARQTSGPQS